jgi:glycosyltransferase involved in cell wall biosynthesis
MRLALFTNQFPSRPTTFFARDVRSWIEAGTEIEIFPIYPLDTTLWSYVPDILDPRILPRHQVHHLPLSSCLRIGDTKLRARAVALARDVLHLSRSAVKHGTMPTLKTLYAVAKAWGWVATTGRERYDHILAYWGNYAATAAYVYQRLTDPGVPFSMFAHARMDLYQTPVFLKQKMLYADNVFVVCEYNRRYIQRHYADIADQLKEKIHVHYLGLDLRGMPRAVTARASKKVIAVGRLEALKGSGNLLRAISLVMKRGIHAELELVGGGEEEENLRRLAQDLGIEEQVTFAGWCRPDEVFDRVRRAAILVHPSIAPDPMPTVISEAMALGTAVIASDLGGIPELLLNGRCGILVPPRDVNALANAIQLLISETDTRERLVQVARTHVEERFDVWRNGEALATRLKSTKRRS